MTAGKKVSKKTESIISYVIILLLVVIAGAVFYARKDFDPAKIGFASEIEAGKGKADFDIEGLTGDLFVSAGEGEVYNSETLYEKINGKAPYYIDSGFVELATYRTMNRQDSGLWAEIYIYDMGDGFNAFAVYSGQKRSNTKPLDIDGYGYKTSNAIFFVSGKYYIEMIGAKESEALLDGLAGVAVNFEKKVSSQGQSGSGIAELFPSDGLIEDSITLYKMDAFGYSEFKNVFAADFEIDGEVLTGFVIKKKSNAEAKELMVKYGEYLISSGFVEKDSKGVITEYEYDGFYELVFDSGSFLGGVHEAFDGEKAMKLAERLYGHLSGLK